MTKYVCLRDCFAYDRFHNEGKIYDLPDGVEKSPKNFRLMDEVPTTPPTPPIPPVYQCPVCGKVVSTRLALSGHSRSHRKEVTHGSPNT